jgi:hypothetical protein
VATNLTWNDGTSATLENVAPDGPGRRFTAWTPFPDLIGPKHAPLGTGRQIAWTHRTDYCVSFQWSQIPRTKFALVDRLIRHLVAGGDVTVNTGDTAARVYTAHLRAGTTPTFERSDPQNIEYTLTLELVNNAAAPLIAEY